MKPLLALLLLPTALLAPCIAAENSGVLVEERVVNLPEDGAKWYVTVFCDRANEPVVSWFRDHEKLVDLKRQTHFNVVTPASPLWNARYASNVKSLPTVRVQDGERVIYEAAGDAIPLSPDGLYSAIAQAANAAQGIRPVLPWRREMERRLGPCPGPGPCPSPQPEPAPVEPDPEPQPLSPGGPPTFVDVPLGVPSGVSVALIVLSVLAGGVAGVVVQWRRSRIER